LVELPCSETTEISLIQGLISGLMRSEIRANQGKSGLIRADGRISQSALIRAEISPEIRPDEA